MSPAGILCNWLVCLAVWQGNMARDFTGKFVGIFLPNSGECWGGQEGGGLTSEARARRENRK